MVLKPGQLGDRISAARRDVGLTQEECASRAELPRTALAKIETGARRVSSLDLARLANTLDMRIEWFFQEAPPAVVSRRNAAEAGAPSPRIDRMSERAAREVEFLQDIGDYLDLPPTPRLHFPNRPEEIEAKASEVRRMLDYGDNEPAVGLAAKSADLGLLAFSFSLGEGADGASILLERGGVAVVNGSRHPGRRRLTLAHELGHYVFADEFSTDWRVGDVSAAETELRIDRWARALLLPAPALRERWRGGEHTRTDAVLIGSEFRVDMATLARRLVELEMVSSAEEEETVRAARISRADIVDFNLVVPTDLKPPELPTIYEKAVLDAYRSEEISAARAVGLLFETWKESELPDLPMLPAEALRFFV